MEPFYYDVQGAFNFLVKVITKSLSVSSDTAISYAVKGAFSLLSYWTVLSYGTVYRAIQGCSKFHESLNGILKYYHSNETY